MALGDLTQSLAADPTYGTSDPETIKRKQLLAAALMNQGMSTEPIRSPWQGAANLAKALIGGYQGGAADREAQAGRKSVLPDLNTAIQPRAVTTPSQAMTTADATPGTNYRDAISSVESGGKYDAIGPDTGGDRAYGRYQVMGANIPAWTKAALGREMTPQEFLADPKAQDATFDHRFGQYVQQYGNPQDAASVWFSGRPMAKAGNASDVLGTTVPGYVAKFNAALGKPQGTQVASADPSFAPQSGGMQFRPDDPSTPGGAPPMPPPRPDDVGMPNSVRPVAQFTNAPVADATDAADGEDKPAPAQVAQAAPAAAQSPMADPRVAAAYRVASNPWATPAQQQIAMTIIKDAMTQKEKYSEPYMDAKGNYVQRASDGSIKVINAAKDSVDKEDNKNHVLGPGAQLVDKAGKVLAKNDGNIPANDQQTEQTVDFLAERVIAGDRQALQNIGRGAQGGALVQAVQQRVAQKAAERGLNAKDLLGNQAQQQGANAEQRTLGTQNARVASAATEAMGAADQAQQAMDALPRTNFVPANKIWQNIESAQSDPNLKQAALALMTLKNTYARAINPNGTPHQGDKEHFDQIMSTADGPAATKAAIDQIRRETAMAQQSPAKAMKILENVRKGKDPMDGVSHDFNTQGIPPMVGAPGEGAQPVGAWDMAKKVLGIGTPSIAPGAIEMLKSNPTPEMRGHFDRKYGAGAAAKVLGQ